MDVNEENFVEHIKNKNQKGLDYIVNSYAKLVYKVVYSVIGSGFHVHSIDECVNDILLSIWNNIDCFDNEKGNLKAWIGAISRYRAIDYRRRLLKDNDIEFDESISEEALFGNKNNTENILLMKEKREQLLNIIKELSEMDRKIFIKRYFLDEDIEDIADELNVKRGVIDNRLSRGRKTLKEKIISLKGEIV